MRRMNIGLRSRALVVLAAASAVAQVGCSSSSSAAGAADAGREAAPARASCIQPGTANNALGLGGYCTSATAMSACPTDGTVCTANYGSTDTFCTTVCSLDGGADGGPMSCGAGVMCVPSPGNPPGCVPIVCLGGGTGQNGGG
jgi:hypothetical protein